MLSYPLPEAESLLISKLETAQQSLANCEEDIDFLREQITVRLYPFLKVLPSFLAPCLHADKNLEI